MQQVSMRNDPAPSRLAYRLERLLLTPLFRLLLRVGLPFALTFGGATLWFANQDNRDAFNLMVSDLRAQLHERPEFMVKVMAIDGASETVSEDIREIMPIDFPVSSFDLDLDQMRDAIDGLDAVKSASIRVRPGGVLHIDVTERAPALVWRNRDGLELIDATGVKVGPTETRSGHAHLPLIVGDGADEKVAEAQQLLAAMGPILSDLRGLVRIGERRWNVVLDQGHVIMLPTKNPVPALERVLAQHQAFDLLARDVQIVDMRIGERPTIRITKNAVEELRRIKAIEVKKTQ